MKKTYLGIGLACLSAGVLVSACGKDREESTDYSYQGLGSKWTAAFTGSNFAITYDATADGTVDMTVNGTYVEYSNKFRKLTVTEASGVGPGGGTPTVGGEAYGLEIPGFAFFLKPLGGNDPQPIVMVASGSCPTQNFDGNWVIAKFQEPDDTPTANTDAFGAASFDVTSATKTATITQRKFGDGAVIGSNSITLTSCTNGVQSFNEGGGNTGTMYMTSNGGALVNPGTGVIFAAPQMSADPTSTDWSGTYSGLVFTDSASSDKLFPAKIVLSGASGTGTKIENLETDAIASGGVTMASLAAVSGAKGLVRGTVDTGSGAQPLNCVVSIVEGKKLLACNGADGAASGGVYPIFFFLGVAR
jgi:hypothetical protein